VPHVVELHVAGIDESSPPLVPLLLLPPLPLPPLLLPLPLLPPPSSVPISFSPGPPVAHA
jgi:hypothetical protein